MAKAASCQCGDAGCACGAGDDGKCGCHKMGKACKCGETGCACTKGDGSTCKCGKICKCAVEGSGCQCGMNDDAKGCKCGKGKDCKCGKKHGKMTHYHPNGRVRSECFYDQDTPIGEHTWWFDDGGVEMIENYRDGIQVRKRVYHRDGRLQYDQRDE